MKVWPFGDGTGRGFIAAGPRWTAENGREGFIGAGAAAIGAETTGASAAVAGAPSTVVSRNFFSATGTVPFDASLLGRGDAGEAAGAIFLRAATNAAAAFLDAAATSVRCGSTAVAAFGAPVISPTDDLAEETGADASDDDGDLRLASPAVAFKGSRAARIVAAALRAVPAGALLADVSVECSGADRVFVGIGRTAPFAPALNAQGACR